VDYNTTFSKNVNEIVQGFCVLLEPTIFMSMTLRDQILKLKSNGKNYNQISDELHCSKGTISYHCNAKVKSKTYARRKQWKSRNTLAYKLHNFKYLNSRKKKLYETGTNDPRLTIEQLKEKIGENPRCYLTGIPINLNNSNEYSLDHIIPLSKGGKNTLDNCGLTSMIANQLKNDSTLSELYGICEMILKNRGPSP